ncbi:dihydropteroate synthase [uncultured Gammaproteobacteria bacterium]
MPPASVAEALAGFMPALGEQAQVYLRPLGLMPVAAWAAGAAVPLAGGRHAFASAEVIVRDRAAITRAIAPLDQIMAWGWQRGRAVATRLDQLLAALTRRREPFGGLDLNRPRLMGIVNVTPDSFSDGGDFFDQATAISHGEALLTAGADWLDIGGESTRPGAVPIAPAEELRRVLPIIAHFAGRGVPISIDTRNAKTMRAALVAGAAVVNDISALTHDHTAASAVAEAGAAVVLMHMQGEPDTMQEAPHYDDAALDVFDWLERRVVAAVAAGIPLSRIAVDPGIGFGKTLGHNLDILRQLSLFHGLGAALALGVSRKRFIAALANGAPSPKQRVPGSLAAGLEGLNQGAQILRVHDVGETTQARAVWEALHPLA